MPANICKCQERYITETVFILHVLYIHEKSCVYGIEVIVYINNRMHFLTALIQFNE